MTDECRRDGDPRDPTQIRRSSEAGDVGDAAAAERDDRPPAIDAEVTPQPVDETRGLCLLTRGHLVRRDEPVAECELRPRAVNARDVRIGDERDRTIAGHERPQRLDRADADVDSCRREDRVVHVLRDGVRDVLVERASFGVEPAELPLVLCERPVTAPHSFPRRVDVDVDPHRERRLTEMFANAGRGDRAAAQSEDEDFPALEITVNVGGLDPAELLLSPLDEQFGDRRLASLDVPVDVDHRSSEPTCERVRHRRLARAHEADQRHVPV